MSSEQVAAVLRQSGREVRLIVARPVNEPSAYPTPHAPVVPTHQLDEHLQQINALLHGEQINQHMADELAAGMIQVHMVISEIHFREEIWTKYWTNIWHFSATFICLYLNFYADLKKTAPLVFPKKFFIQDNHCNWHFATVTTSVAFVLAIQMKV